MLGERGCQQRDDLNETRYPSIMLNLMGEAMDDIALCTDAGNFRLFLSYSPSKGFHYNVATDSMIEINMKMACRQQLQNFAEISIFSYFLNSYNL